MREIGRPELGSICLWELDPQEFGGELAAERQDLLTFCYYLTSPGTHAVKAYRTSPQNGRQVIEIIGPECLIDGRLYVKRTATRKEFSRLKNADRERVADALRKHINPTRTDRHRSPVGVLPTLRTLNLPLNEFEKSQLRRQKGTT